MITIVDYGMGNLGSIQNMFKRIGVASRVSSDCSELAESKKILLPGVGSFDAAMERINQTGFRDILEHKALIEKTPILGICLGMQLMCQSSEEGVLPGLGWIDAEVKRFNLPVDGVFKIPHMGWNPVEIVKPNPLVAVDMAEQRFYFVHSYHVVCNRQEDVLATTHHGYHVTAAFNRDNLFGAQFHPEKSHRFGMGLLKNFAEIESC